MSYMTKTKTMTMVAAAAALSFTVSSPANAADFSGKTITLLVPYGEGGGSDTVARLMQPYLAEALPGKPTVIVLNQPGGGGIKGTNKWESSAPRDGTELVVNSTSAFISFTFGVKSVKYNPLKWEGVMGLPRGAVLYANPEQTKVAGGPDNIKSDIEKLRGTKVVNGAKTPVSAETLDIVALELLGIEPKPVFGLSTSGQRKAYMRGETNFNNDGTGVFVVRMKENAGEPVTPLFTYGYMAADGKIKRDPEFQELPTWNEVYETMYGKAPSGPGYDAYLNLYANKVSLSKVIALPPDTPKDIVDTHVAAFQKIYENPELKEKLVKEFGGLPVTFGEETNKALREGLDLKASSKEWLNNLLQTKYNASL